MVMVVNILRSVSNYIRFTWLWLLTYCERYQLSLDLHGYGC